MSAPDSPDLFFLVFLNTCSYKKFNENACLNFFYHGTFLCMIFFRLNFLHSWVARDVIKNQTKKLSIFLSFYFHEVLQYLNTFT